jgi:diguanylate cyclase (GGDEF)-like protein
VDAPALPDNEAARLAVLRSLNILDTQADEHFDRITRIAAITFNVPTALVSLVDADRQWFKSCFGLDASETPRDISFCGHAILHDEAFVVEDATKDPRFADNPLVVDEPKLRFYAGRPLKYNGVFIGTLCVIDYKPRTFSETDRIILKDLASLVVEEIRVRDLALTDELTGICNRRGFIVKCHHMLEVAKRNQLEFDLVFVDLNKFKKINDAYGHAEGDEVLKHFAASLLDVCRQSDLPARLAGDEFALLINSNESSVLKNVMERLKAAFSARLEAKPYNVDFSYGVAEYHSDEKTDIDALLAQADTVMYRHKKGLQP